MKVADNAHEVTLVVAAGEYPDIRTPWNRTIRPDRVTVRYDLDRDRTVVIIEGPYISRNGRAHPRMHRGSYGVAADGVPAADWPEVARVALRHVQETGLVPADCQAGPTRCHGGVR
jgi:hypothetical protein